MYYVEWKKKLSNLIIFSCSMCSILYLFLAKIPEKEIRVRQSGAWPILVMSVLCIVVRNVVEKLDNLFFSWKVHILGFQKVTNFDNVSKPDSQEIFQSRDIATTKIKYRWLMWSQKRWQFLYKIQTLIIRTYS